ncbi:MAG: glycerate kinase [Ruminococcaceae bacterium]|nr:glycerate kinase [Oscillospiraceae bacterium]
MKILVCPDSFKGSLSSYEAANAVKEGILKNSPDSEITLLPLADGGEGTAECLKRIVGGEYRKVKTKNIFFEELDGDFLLLKDGSAFVETATASGIMTVEKPRLNPLKASTYGTGLIIKKSVENGADRIIVGLGGSATNDGGMGALNALGVDFLDENQKVLEPSGENMIRAKSVSIRDEFSKYKNIKFTLACDVENPFYGKNGAAYVFASQKGAGEKEIEFLDRGLKNLSEIYNSFSKKDIQSVSGSGAAGGLCGGLYSFFDCEIKSGFDVLSEKAGLEELIKSADLVITGEGRTDYQTSFGKLPFKISALCKKYGKRCVLLSGDISPDADIKGMGFESAYKIMNKSITLENAIKNAYNLLVETAKNIEVER